MPGTKDVGSNITELRQANKGRAKARPEKQILAIALSQAREAGAKIAPPKKPGSRTGHHRVTVGWE